MDSSSKQCTNFRASKALSSDNITSGAVSSVSRPAAKIVEILCQSQKRDLLGVVDVSVSKVNF